MELLLTDDQKRPIPQVEAALLQPPAQLRIGAAIANFQTGNSAAQLTELGEMAAEGTAAIENQHRGGRGIGDLHPACCSSGFSSARIAPATGHTCRQMPQSMQVSKSIQ